MPHRLALDRLVDRGVRRLRDDGVLFAALMLVLVRAGGAIEEASRHRQQARVRYGRAPLAGAQRSSLAAGRRPVRETFPLALVEADRKRVSAVRARGVGYAVEVLRENDLFLGCLENN